ncbi:hypothetical protein QO019_006646 [Streptomyces thermodiastaticus]|uniref:Uncharacterized protein n=1 Tax=Streptomyces thermodiastaticus TaxID=44061 RepID=A0ABU0KQM6_9ACTN|nr:hypothetical protein [Streptomyces thermodiastaticus]
MPDSSSRVDCTSSPSIWRCSGLSDVP